MMPLNIYTLMIGLAVCVGLAYARRQTRSWDVLMDALIMAFAALALGRLGYVALHWQYFADHVNEILSLASPGFQEHATLCGGFIGNWLLAVRDRSASLITAQSDPIPIEMRSKRQLPILFCISLIGIAASLGCIANGCAVGREVFWQSSGERSLAWLIAVDWPDAYGIKNPRLPTQLFMAGWLCVVGVVIWMSSRTVTQWNSRSVNRTTSYQRFTVLLPYWSTGLLLWLILFTPGDFVIQFARADETLIWMGLRAEQWADVLLGLLAAAGIVRTRLRD